jgi:hypothetical protein
MTSHLEDRRCKHKPNYCTGARLLHSIIDTSPGFTQMLYGRRIKVIIAIIKIKLNIKKAADFWQYSY